MKSGAKENDVFIEFRENSVHLLTGEKGWDGRVDRDAQGNPSASSIQSLAHELGVFDRALKFLLNIREGQPVRFRMRVPITFPEGR